MRCFIAVLVTLPVYKRISVLINRLNDRFASKQCASFGEQSSSECEAVAKKNLIIRIAVCAGVVLLLIGGVLLRYFLA